MEKMHQPPGGFRSNTVRRIAALVTAGGLAVTIGAIGLTPSSAEAGTRSVHRVTAGDFADPGFVKVGSRYYIYKTGGFGVKSSASATGGYGATRATLTRKPAWVNQGAPKLWAPDVFASSSGGKRIYVMYFTGVAGSGRQQGVHCLGIATSTSPGGGFSPQSKPVLCAAKTGYEAIDPTHYVAADGTRYMAYKINYRNASGFDIRAVQMNPAGTHRAAGVASRSKIAPGSRIEGPSILRHGGDVYMFTSRGDYVNCTYSTDVWRADTFWKGTFRRVGTVMASNRSAGLCGPGGATVIQDGGTTRVAFHAYADSNGNGVRDSGVRRTYVATLTWSKSGVPSVV
jgi:hypothetical protein